MNDNIIFVIGCFVLFAVSVEVLWSVTLYILHKLDYFFYRRYLDRIAQEGTIEE
jgi:glucose-6-phosphate-specific signal transduction histidine kinase